MVVVAFTLVSTKIDKESKNVNKKDSIVTDSISRHKFASEKSVSSRGQATIGHKASTNHYQVPSYLRLFSHFRYLPPQGFKYFLLAQDAG